jgi:ParB-like chromosome segregation protein Spo0J
MTKPNWSLKKVKLSDLKDYHKNPRQLSENQAEQLKKSVDKFGLIDKPIVNQDMTLIGGHQRKNVLNGEVEEIEVWFPDRSLDEKEVEELNIRLNANTGSWDFDVLANEWKQEELEEWGLEAINFQDYSDKNKEIDTDEIEDKMIIKLEYTQDEYFQVKEQLSKIAATPEGAVWKLLGNE